MARAEVPGSGRATTLSDVAKLAGVSIATASKAINGRDEVAPATRRRVLEAAEQISFTPNQLARGLLAGSLAAAQADTPTSSAPAARTPAILRIRRVVLLMVSPLTRR